MSGPEVRAALRGDRAARKAVANSALGAVGLTVEPTYHSLDAQRTRLLSELGLTGVVDVGANVGQYARNLRARGFTGRIVSFEPTPAAFARLQGACRDDPDWEAHGVALGSSAGRQTIHVTVDSQSTSLLQPRDNEYAFMRSEEQTSVEVSTLDEFAAQLTGRRWLLKLDVQGFELEVLRGARAALDRCDAVECELSAISLYRGQPLMEEVIAHLRLAGYDPVTLRRGFTDPTTHQVVQYDGLFARS